MVSEEMEQPCQIPPAYPRGKYLLVFDPLDGSSNLDVNVTVGSIFSILRAPDETVATGRDVVDADFLQTGDRAGGRRLRGVRPGTMLVLTVGHGTHEFTLEREVGSFMLTHPSMRIPEDCKEFAINMSNQRHWEPPMQRFQHALDCIDGGRRTSRILTRGGVFYYPLDAKIRAQGGKLRLMYEANPMAFIIEQAGGAATTGRTRIMDVQPTALHQRLPVFLGSKKEVEVATRYHVLADVAQS
ncbi:MAG: hypothetical protein WDW36_003352 [Sanguina aurantia]